MTPLYLRVFVYACLVLASATLVTCQDYMYPTVAESSRNTHNCTKGVTTECISPAKFTCLQSCMMKNGGGFCTTCRCQIKQNTRTDRGAIAAFQPSGTCPNLKCYGDYKVHHNIPTWTRDSLLDICSVPEYIEAGYFPTIDANQSKVTFSEATKCTGQPNCPKERYLSNEISPIYERYENGTYVWKSHEQRSSTSSTGNPDALRATICYSVFLVLFVLKSIY
ncbi:uncharacterized protein LOC125653550 [Ostrea edulis]|uniref:uncharacterized protein LOC125653550 n=1 Tax=Ostrea edulis TaxID=37623 RepID=UPI0024AFA4F6|nr:uncharacterized protein LOC125653550 [Ostrea edulis]